MNCASNIKTVKYVDGDLSAFETFEVVASPSSFKTDEFQTKSEQPIDQSLIALINTKMEDKGFSVAPKNSDLVIFLVSSNEIKSEAKENKESRAFASYSHTSSDSFSNVVGLAQGYGRYNSTDVDAKNVPLKSGALLVEVFNRESKELLWIGVAKDFKSHISDQTHMTSMIDEVFKRFPN